MTEDEMVGWHHSVDISLGELQELVMDREAMGDGQWVAISFSNA